MLVYSICEGDIYVPTLFFIWTNCHNYWNEALKSHTMKDNMANFVVFKYLNETLIQIYVLLLECCERHHKVCIYLSMCLCFGSKLWCFFTWSQCHKQWNYNNFRTPSKHLKNIYNVLFIHLLLFMFRIYKLIGNIPLHEER